MNLDNDNEKHSDLSGFGTAHVNINGMNVADYCQTDFQQEQHKIKNIKAKPG